MIDYRPFRLSRLNTPEFSHLKLLLFWPFYGLCFLLLERFVPAGSGAAEKCALPRPETVCGIREAALAPQEIVPVEESIGRICAAVKVPCPPAVPIVLSGERIDEACIRVCQAYGITEISVVQ